MAKMFPPSTKGYEEEHYSEIEIYMFLKYMLSDDYYVFWNVRVDNKYPDFIIVEPTLGLLILEVKDWALETIHSSNAKHYYFKPNKVSKLNPLEQATTYKNKIENVLRVEENLLQNDGIYKGNLKFCRACGVVFTNIEKSSFLNSSNKDSIDQTLILFKDEIKDMENRKDIGLLRKKFEDMFIPENSFYFEPLSSEDMFTIRKILYRESEFRKQVTISNNDNDEHTYNKAYIDPNEIPLVSRPLYDQMFLKNAKKVSSRKRYRNPNSKRVMMVLVIFIVTLNVLYRLPNNSLNILYKIPNNFRNAFASIIENIIDKSPGVLNHSQANDQITPQPIMTFKVGSHPGARGTFILIKDGKRYFTSKIYTEGSIIEFYEDKKIIINDVKADIEEFIAENDVIELEVGNTYTKIYLSGEVYKFVKNFKFDFVNKKIIN